MENNDQSLKQKKISLAQGENASVMIEMVKDCMTQTPLLAENEFKTLVNAITLEVHSNLLKRLVDYIEEIKEGSLLNQK